MGAENKLIIEDTIIPREDFTKRPYKIIFRNNTWKFKSKNNNGLWISSIAPIIENISFNYQKCTFHAMKNLIEELIKKHNRLYYELKN